MPARMPVEATAPFAPVLRCNQLLAQLPEEFFARHGRDFVIAHLAAGEVFDESGGREKRLCFPLDCVISLVRTMADGACAEYAMVGSEGALGLSMPDGGEDAAGRAIIEKGGHAASLPARILVQGNCDTGSLCRTLLRYTQTFISQLAQNAACNRLHSVEQRLCRWLLLTAHRTGTAEVTITHERAAALLGVQRESVTIAAGKLQRDGLIRYARGRLVILERSGLEACACECYQTAMQEHGQLLGRERIDRPAQEVFPRFDYKSRPVYPSAFAKEVTLQGR